RNLTHNTYNPSITIKYPFHPYYGRTLPIIFESNRPEPSYLCFVDNTHRTRVPKWMTEPEAEFFSFSQHPIIDPFALLQAHQLINDVFKSHFNFDTFDPILFQKEVENETRSNATTPKKKIKSTRGNQFSGNSK
ncbi:hypothetical protein MHK_001867, partial [Candidatus Magnetomorum sp. HK-1]